ncbi:hypothetical protein L596_002891 [Steinernema carpocapsae]|uniref:cGMP-dependent protein kinase interacting domain-containing protein n=1 Tax=Steinernema carpocapsae TaxID=34508 RepID=A0A4U8UQI9_STECR|nr:hypothetical protein L596_002891 [Steinernema carpocapsae]
MISGIDPPDFVDEAEHLQMLQTKQSMANNVLWQRKEQLDRWQTSDMNKLPPSRRPVHNFKVKFGEKDVLFAACMSGDEDEVEQLQQKGIDINTCGMDGVTVLHQAVIDDKYDTVKFLVEHGADINVQDNEGWTPLHAAVCCANLDIIQYLCTMGADLTVVNSDMELAIDLAKEDECKEYLEGEYAKNNITFEECRNREHQVIQRDCAEWTTRGVFGDVPHQRTGATALHVAASKNYLDLLVPLLKSGADVHAGDVDGWTPLHAAAHWGHLQMCRLLLENGASLEDTNYAGDNVIRVADKAIIEDLEKLQLLFKDVERPGQVLQNNNSLSSRKTSRSEEKLQIHIHEDFGQNENTSISSASHECSPPPAKKKETDDRRIISSQDPVEPPAMNSSFTTSARVELVKPSDDVTIESDLIRLPSQSVSMDDEDEDLSKETSVSSVESKVSSASSCDQSDRNLVSSSDDLSKSHSASEISQTSSPSDFTTRLPLLESSSENAVPQRPTKLSDSVRRNYDFSSNDSRSQDVSISSAERSSNTTSRESSVGSKESSNSSHVEFTVRMKGNRAGWLQDGKRADAKKTVGAIPSIRPASSTSSNASSANSSSPLQSPMQRKTFPPVVSNVQRCASSPSTVPWASLLRSNGHAISTPSKSNGSSGKSLAEEKKSTYDNTGENSSTPSVSRNIKSSPAYTLFSSKLRSWQTPPMQPSQKDEREAERKAKSRMQRATRRSTQAITTEDLNSARSWKSSALTLEGVDDGDQEFDKKEQSSLESNGSVTQSSSNSSVNADAPVPNAGSTLSPIVPSPAHTPSAAHLRRRSHVNRANRRGTGPVSMDDIQAASCSLQGRDEETGNGVVLPNIRLDMNGSTDSERVKDEINYKILYEGEQRTNDKLLKQIEQLEKKLLESEQRVSALSLTRSTFANSATLDEKDKRFYERKIEELENRTKDYEQMRNDNKRLKEENGALIRVISKLSK